MTSAEALNLVRQHFESLFPKVCPNCGRRYETLREYIRITTPKGPAVSYDADMEDWAPKQPIGSLAFADCPCGNTLALGTESMALADRLALLDWVRQQCQERNVDASTVLEGLRAAVRQALA